MDHTIPPPRHLLARLQSEWNRLKVSPDAIATASEWGLVPGPLRSLDDLLRRAGYGVVGKGTHSDDTILQGLMRIGRHDPLAARVVLQRLLPGISAVARRYPYSHHDGAAALDEAVATAWTVIRMYPVDRRPRYIAANMLREIEYRSFHSHRRRKCEFVPTLAAVFELSPATTTAMSPAEELRDLLDEARCAGLDAADVELAERLASGATAEQLAAEKNVTSRTIRNHRAIVVHRLRQVALACA
jgi:DNA-binding NarL/FixJ family response regulator